MALDSLTHQELAQAGHNRLICTVASTRIERYQVSVHTSMSGCRWPVMKDIHGLSAGPSRQGTVGSMQPVDSISQELLESAAVSSHVLPVEDNASVALDVPIM